MWISSTYQEVTLISSSSKDFSWALQNLWRTLVVFQASFVCMTMPWQANLTWQAFHGFQPGVYRQPARKFWDAVHLLDSMLHRYKAFSNSLDAYWFYHLLDSKYNISIIESKKFSSCIFFIFRSRLRFMPNALDTQSLWNKLPYFILMACHILI